MCFGFGIHTRDEHVGSHINDTQNINQQKHIDPVCGMELDVELGYGKMRDGNLYRFCSRDCLDKFDADPEQHVKNQDHDGHHHDGHHHEGSAL